MYILKNSNQLRYVQKEIEKAYVYEKYPYHYKPFFENEKILHGFNSCIVEYRVVLMDKELNMKFLIIEFLWWPGKNYILQELVLESIEEYHKYIGWETEEEYDE